MLPLKRKTASSSVGTLPPLQVIFWIERSSPEPVAASVRFQPGEGSNESIAKPSGTVSSISVVVAPSSSVGTERVNCCSTFAFAMGGLMIACAEAALASTSVSAAAPAAARANLIGLLPFAWSGLRPRGAAARANGPAPRAATGQASKVLRRRRRPAARAGGGAARGRPRGPRRARARPPRRAPPRRGPAPRAAGSRSGAPGRPRLGERCRGERQRREQRDRVPVHRPDQAREPVEADPGAPVQVRLEHGEREAAGEGEGDPGQAEPATAEAAGG